ncbi:hypothetical protein [Pseudofrankia sp. DC12]|uniref:hypothetical protein n=1 Tax=Pseudofrankia sp. DC12 TaxID=683315 RepID=UPI0005F82871|nr:hypothetical protein [Pseudofrankia sp. DC12]
MVACEVFLDDHGIADSQARALIDAISGELDNDERRSEGMFDAVISDRKVRQLIQRLRDARRSIGSTDSQMTNRLGWDTADDPSHSAQQREEHQADPSMINQQTKAWLRELDPDSALDRLHSVDSDLGSQWLTVMSPHMAGAVLAMSGSGWAAARLAKMPASVAEGILNAMNRHEADEVRAELRSKNTTERP